MHKVSISYIDYFDDNKPRVEDLYFNINAFELAEIAVEFDGDLGEYMRKAFRDQKNYKDGFKVLKLLFVKGYGRRQEIDGRQRFLKDPNWVAELLPSPEFEKFYLDLSENAAFAAEFWNGLVSEELLKRAKLIEENGEVQAVAKKGSLGLGDLPLDEQVRLLKARNAVLEKTPANEQ